MCRNSGAQNWSPSKNRFLDQSRRSRDQPGPGAYNPSDMNSNLGGSYIVSNFKNTANNVKFIKPATLHGGGSALRSRTPMVNRAATSKSFFDIESGRLFRSLLVNRLSVSFS